jgi:hypothetical protein
MPRPPKPESLDNPLRKLRELLGTEGKPMSQQQMAGILKLPLETYKSIEIGRFRSGVPYQKTFDLILERFGAVWDEKEKRWDSCYPGLPFTLQNYELRKHARFDRINETDTLANGLISLLLKASDKEFASLSDAIYRELYRLARAYRISSELVPNLPYVDKEFSRMDLALVNIWRDGKNTKNPADIVGLTRERGFHTSRGDRELLDFRYRNSPAKEAQPRKEKLSRSKPSSRRRSKRVSVDGAPKTSLPQPR